MPLIIVIHIHKLRKYVPLVRSGSLFGFKTELLRQEAYNFPIIFVSLFTTNLKIEISTLSHSKLKIEK